MHPLWLWPESEGRIRWWGPAGTDLLERPNPERCGSLEAREALYEGGRERALSTVVDRPVATLLTDQVRRYGSVRLRLAENLSAHWHTCAYESLLVDGQPLFDRLAVERYASPQDCRRGGLPPLGKGVIFDLLGKRDRGGFYEALNEAHLKAGAQIFQGLPHVEHFLAQKDMSQRQLLCVVVHGTECAADRPFRLENDTRWELPLDSGLPPVVILLVCGGFDGNLIE